MKIEAGKRYIRKDGKITGNLIRRESRNILIFLDPTDRQSYSEDGKWGVIGDFPFDLVRQFASHEEESE